MDFSATLEALPAAAPLLLMATSLVAIYLLYSWLLPKPIPGIPFNPEATRSIFGDAPSMLNHLKTSKTVTDWFGSHHKRHNSPIVQIWVSLFRKQCVIIDDFREAQDILIRRTREFDKPDLISDVFWGVAPQFHANLVTGDTWRSQRKSVSDLMTPAFLNGVAAPQLYATFTELIALWKQKMRLAAGHPFSVKQDVYEAALEAVWGALFGNDVQTATKAQLELLAKKQSISIPTVNEEAVEFERPPAPAVFEAVLRLTDSIESTVKSPWPYVTGFLQRYYPSLRKHANLKNRAIAEQIRRAEKRMAENEQTDEAVVSNGVDHILHRERLAAEKEKRPPVYHSTAIKDDLFGLLMAGHDTTSTTLLWTLKLLSNHPTIQTTLRSSLHAAFPTARAYARAPTAQEIATTPNAYLDACIEECIRCSTTSALPARTATRDAVVLGHVIPKGTRVTFISNGAGVITAPHEIPERLRSTAYRKAGGGKTRDWEVSRIREFDPRRWLVYDAETKMHVFDAQAGPHLQFGMGLRGCYGRKMAYLELRIAVVLVVWEMELQSVPEKYNGWGVVEMMTRSPVQAYARLSNTMK